MTHTPTPAQARHELDRRGRNDLGRKTHKPSASKARRRSAQKTRTFDMGTKALVRLAQAEVTSFTVTADELARMVEPSAQTSTGSIVLDNTSVRNLAHVA